MPRVKQASKHARTSKAAAAATALGTAGLGLSLGGSASANTIPTADFPQSHNIPPDQRFVLGEEEMADVSLATFYLFDKEIAHSDMQLAYVVRRGCGGCRGCRGCRGCAVRRLRCAWMRWLRGVRGAAAAAQAGDGAAYARFHDLADER